MPRMDDAASSDESSGLIKLLLIGDGKIGKTHYAGMAAMAGFNVVYFDGDVAMPTLRSLPIEARKRIYAFDIRDSLLAGGRDAKCLESMLEFIKEPRFIWNDSKQKLYSKKSAEVGDAIWTLRPGKMNHDVVFVMDSWTSFSESVMLAWANDAGVDMMDNKITEMRDGYRIGGLKSTQMLAAIRSLRCHVIVIAHPDEYTHTTKPTGKSMKEASRENDLIVDWTKMVPKSTSKPVGFSMSKYFTDIGWAEASAAGERMIDFRINKDRLSGGHFHERGTMENFSFGNLIKLIGGKIPNGTQEISDWLTFSEHTEAASQATPVLSMGAKPTEIQSKPLSSGMASLLKKPA
jgi:hypothetical protein